MNNYNVAELSIPPLFSDDSDSEHEQFENQTDTSAMEIDEFESNMDQFAVQFDSNNDVGSMRMEQTTDDLDFGEVADRLENLWETKRQRLRSQRRRDNQRANLTAINAIPTIAEEGSDDDQSGAQVPSQEEILDIFLNFLPPNLLTLDRMVKNCIHYLLIKQHSKLPIKRADLVREAMNSQFKLFPKVLIKLKKELDDTFGIKLITLDKTAKGFTIVPEANDEENEEVDSNVDGEAAGSSQNLQKGRKGEKGKGKAISAVKKTRGKSPPVRMYMVVSKFQGNSVNSFLPRDLVTDTKNSVVFLVLSTIFMEGRPISEDRIWKIMEKLEFHKILNANKRQTFATFLRLEFVNTGYFAAKVGAKGDNEYTSCVRGDLEYSKLQMLKFVHERTANSKLYEFHSQCKAIMRGDNGEDKKELVKLLEEEDRGLGRGRKYSPSAQALENGDTIYSWSDSSEELLDPGLPAGEPSESD